jgi:hypothetical protein
VSDLIERYAAAERAGRARIPNRAIEAFGLAAFEKFGYPYRIESIDELWRYHDVMHEGKFKKNLSQLGSVSEAEVELLKWLATSLADFSERRFGRRLSGRHAATKALLQYRLIESQLAGREDLPILELGPGSGYLTCLLVKKGCRVHTVEPAQAFALYQTIMFGEVLGCFEPTSEAWPPVPRAREGRVTQIPWWDFADLSEPVCEYRLVTANHALAEFDPRALSYILRRLGVEHRTLFQRNPLLVAEALGSYVLSDWSTTVQRITQHGWIQVNSGLDSKFVFKYEPELVSKHQRKTNRYGRRLLRRARRSPALRHGRNLRERTLKNLRHRLMKRGLGTLAESPDEPSHVALTALFDSLDHGAQTSDERWRTRYKTW